MKRALKWLVYGLAGLMGLVIISVCAIYGVSEIRFRKQYVLAPPPLAIPTDSASVARGEHLANTVAFCVDCHGENLAGNTVVDQPILGRVFAANLTRGKGGVTVWSFEVSRSTSFSSADRRSRRERWAPSLPGRGFDGVCQPYAPLRNTLVHS